MNLSPTQQQSDRETILLTEIYYSVESGYGENMMPILYCCGRSESGERRHVRIHSFRPRFYCSKQEFVNKRGSIEKQMNKQSGAILDYGMGHKLMDGRKTLDGVMIVCETPNDVDDLAENFSRTWEADVPFTEVFKTDNGISQYFSVPRGKQEVHHSQVRSEDDSGVEIHDRVCTFDIEVKSDEGFPDPYNPTQEITAITAHDSYTNEYWSGILQYDNWSSEDKSSLRSIFNESDKDGSITIYGREKELLYDFVNYLNRMKFDIITGWNIA